MRLTFAVTFAFSSALLGAGEEDQLTLANGDFFAGKVLALEDGLIQLRSPHSPEPLKILNDGLVSLSFAKREAKVGETDPLPKDPQEIILENGDRFPGELAALDQDQIRFKTWFTGELSIPRHQISSLLFSVTPQKSVYRGPKTLEGWNQESTRNWTLKDGKLSARQRSFIGRDFNLPDHFIFRSTISWENSPKCRVHLCARKTELENNNAGDSYLFSLSSSGLQLQRVSVDDDGETSYQQILNNSVGLRSESGKSVEVEIHINRANRMIHLFLNGEKVGQGIDPVEAPSGGCIIFESLDHSNSGMTVSEISIDEWDTKTRVLRLEPPAGEDLDTLAIKDGDRFSGSITSFDPTGTFSIKTPLAPEPIVIPLEHCAVMYFSGIEELPESTGDYKINLRVGGSLTVSKIKLGADSLTATHPWLGELEIDRRAMKSITKG